MKFLFTILLSIFAITGYCQNCNLEINDIDPRTNLKILRTEFEQLARVNGNPFLVKAQAIGEKRYLKFRYYRYNNFEIEPGSDLELILSDNSVVALQPYVSPADTVQDQSTLMTVSSLVIYPIPSDAYKKLTEANLRKLKFFVSGGYVYEDVKEKKQAIIRNLLNCVK